MKQISNIFFLFLAATVFVACSDDDNKGGPSTAPAASMYTTYKDTAGSETTWKATSVEAEQDADGFWISGSTSNPTESFGLHISSLAVGDYHDATIIYTRMVNSDMTVYSDGMGDETFASVSVTEVDTVNKTVTGTFQYVLANVMQASDFIYNTDVAPGVFTKIPYTLESDGGGGTGGIGDGTLRVDLDGTTMTDNDAFGMSIFNSLIVSGEFGTKSLSISMPADITAGTYELGGLGSTLSVTYSTDDQSFFSTSGSLVILSHNVASKTISGTFHGTLTDILSQATVQATNGSFDITYF